MKVQLPAIKDTEMNLPVIPENWDYDESVSYLKPKINNWKKETFEIAQELYIVDKILSSPGRRTDLTLSHFGTRLPTFREYCKEIGIPKTSSLEVPVKLPTLAELGKR